MPWGWAEDPRLGSWVNTQRKLRRRLDRGEPTAGMTAERATRLTALGLVWEPPSCELSVIVETAYPVRHKLLPSEPSSSLQ